LRSCLFKTTALVRAITQSIIAFLGRLERLDCTMILQGCQV
jgi:hypothetical protein